MAAPFPEAWATLLGQRVPFWREWSPALRAEAEPLIQVFADEQRFVGAAGFEITEAVRVILSACAVRPALRLGLGLYDAISEIVVYPYDQLVVPEHGDQVLGVAHPHCVVVLSWPAVEAGLARAHDGHDTALHEFVHILDLADGAMDGIPPLRHSREIDPWIGVFGDQLGALRRGEPGPLRSYGAVSLPELFAVASEHFFERPAELRAAAPALFARLEAFYCWAPDRVAGAPD